MMDSFHRCWQGRRASWPAGVGIVEPTLYPGSGKLCSPPSAGAGLSGARPVSAHARKAMQSGMVDASETPEFSQPKY